MTNPDQNQSTDKPAETPANQPADQYKDQPVDKMVQAYEQMLKRTQETLETAGKETAPRFRDLLDTARESVVELGELTREEAVKVSDYLRRDLEDAASYIAETGQDIRDWWRFDLELIERRMMDMFARAADQTGLQLAQLAENARQFSLYQAGEVTGPGTLLCDKCGAATHFVQAGRIPPCADCGGTAFKRKEQVQGGRTGT